MKKKSLPIIILVFSTILSSSLISSNLPMAVEAKASGYGQAALPLLGSLALVAGLITGYQGRKWIKEWKKKHHRS